MPDAPQARPPRDPRPRDPRLDVLRGLALVTIFLTHATPNAFEAYTLRAWGFSDAAEGFVLMAGVSAGLAYGPAFRPGGDARAGVARAWGRAWTLYAVHVLVTVLALGLAAGLALWADRPALLHSNGMDALLLRPIETLAALPLLLHQIAYANILPLYALFLLAAPLLLVGATRAPWLTLAASVALWVVSGTWRLNLPTWPYPGGWLFSPLSWQVLFVVGILTGLRLREGRRLVPASRALVAAASAFLAVAFLWRVVPPVGATGNAALRDLQAAGAPWVLTAFHKTWETAPRLLHALALAYVMGTLPVVRRLCAARLAWPLALLGRHALPVFALLTLLAFAVQGLKIGRSPEPALDAALLGGGLLLMLALAFSRERRPR